MLIIGMTESGKTTFATRLSEQYHKENYKIIVLDPLIDPRWKADFITNDEEQFLSVVKSPKTRSCQIFIDESGESIGRYNSNMFFLATRARHYGHNSHFISQRGSQLSKTVRDQCSILVLFNCSFTDAKNLSDEWNRPELKNASQLQQGEYFYVPRFGALQKRRLF